MTAFVLRIMDAVSRAGKRLLLLFRSTASNGIFMVLTVLAYQAYLLLTVGPGPKAFHMNADALSLAALLAGLDVLLFALRQFVKLNSQILYGVDLLLTTGFAAQTVFVSKCMNVNANGILKRDALWVAVGLLLAAVCLFICRYLTETKYKRLFALAMFVMLMGAAGVMTVLSLRGTQWIAGGSMQPGEFVKFGFLFFVAYVASVSDAAIPFPRKMALIFTSYILLALTYVMQSELGSLLVVTAVFVLFLLVYNNSWRWTLLLGAASVLIVGAALAVMIRFGNLYVETLYASENLDANYFDRFGSSLLSRIGYHFGVNYKKVYLRFMVCRDINCADSAATQTLYTALNDASYQAKKAFEAIGISGFLSSAPYFRYVPIGQSDYIYTSVIQTGGYLAVLVMLFAYLHIIDASLHIVCRNCSLFSRYSAFVMMSSLVLQMLINVMGTNNIIPLTGITIPFVSYGGSSLAVSCMMIAVILLPDKLYLNEQRQAEKKGGNRIAEIADPVLQCS